MTREDVIQKIKDDLRLHHDYLSGDYRKALRIAIEALQQPEIIRCKECKYWFDIDDGRQRHRMCADFFGDWFCADAERREG